MGCSFASCSPTRCFRALLGLDDRRGARAQPEYGRAPRSAEKGAAPATGAPAARLVGHRRRSDLPRLFRDEPRARRGHGDGRLAARTARCRRPVDLFFLEAPIADYVEYAVQTVSQLHAAEPPGDILLFLTGQQEVEIAVSQLADRAPRGPGGLRLLPLPIYAGLTPTRSGASSSRRHVAVARPSSQLISPRHRSRSTASCVSWTAASLSWRRAHALGGTRSSSRPSRVRTRGSAPAALGACGRESATRSRRADTQRCASTRHPRWRARVARRRRAAAQGARHRQRAALRVPLTAAARRTLARA